MAHFYVPVENRRAPAHLRWFLAEYDTASPVDAMMQAREDFPTSLTVWAAVREAPEFGYMQYLRDCLEASRGRTLMPMPYQSVAA